MSRREGAPVVIAGGGTGGHVFPGIAVARELRRLRPERPIEWIGARGGMEERLVPGEGITLTLLPLAGAARLGLARKLKAGGLALLGTMRCVARFLKRRPVLLIGVGGFASGPAALAALVLGVPLLLLEQNATPGATNRWLSSRAAATAVSFEEGREKLKGRVVVTGNPVRDDIAKIEPRRRGEVREVLSFGGSRGAQSLNEAWMGAARLLEDLSLRFVIQTGPRDLERVSQALAATRLDADVRAFLDDMPARLASADLVVSRSGATTVAELTAAGRASLLVPFPFAAGDHQRANARALERAGAALMLDPDDLSAASLAARVRELVSDAARIDAMSQAARGLARPDAASRVADLALEVAGGAL